MQRKEFLRRGLAGIGTIVALPTVVSSCTKEEGAVPNTDTGTGDGSCDLSPSETKGPFPIKTPADLVRANIIADRDGIALLVTLTVQDQNDDCATMAGVYVDIWHCDSDGNYSEYGGTGMQSTNYTNQHFLRGRQMTDANGQVSFISIYPGWYRGRAPHIHVEVLDANLSSLLVTQIAFPEDVSQTVYATEDYNGIYDTSNASDNVFADSLDGNMGQISGNTSDGYTLTHTIVVNG
ncbi:dioxygenase family protein [Flavilitoribacter nigricans]|uniref:Intradiol ring-cleavage dioxygenase n=1 Tax=Flavilitoribacter nigricans (strain ATCC 23147 / DSM 23189 / NBRC 102662 / NCIMB 1420 / SS-2) TaxID=1122177 RepID=A0A2D0NEB6_FLAN2|nr:intradiol ring-cleavage dioxygenase [Flavilitoribacter nigricans]PHN06842.1 intradiol ring-cleavage dioxygenase [Flavilitoribacter nigricans DSM 23189 = NBRC 102662]